MSRPFARLGILALSAALAACASTPEATPDTAAKVAPTGDTLANDIGTQLKTAQLKRAQGDYAGAIRMLSQMMLIQPDDPRVVGEYGKTLVQQGRSPEGIDFLKRGIELAPGDWTLYSALGIAYDQTKNYAAARIAYERALILKPGEAVVLSNYAMSRVQAGDLVQARALIAQASASKDPRVAKNAELIAELSAHVPVAAAVPVVHPEHPAATAPKPAMAASAPPKNIVAATPATVSVKAAPVAISAKATPAPAKPTVKVAKKAHPAAKVAATKPATPKTAKAQPVKIIKGKPEAVAKTDAAGQIPALRLANDRL
jgi:Flp pilus assembly protein TadD